jgi:pimeloyl-ACP methyl ester carboxylesterase
VTTVETITVRTPDGRELCVEVAGDPAGKPVLVHNGTPNSRRAYSGWVADALVRNARLISYDRPGYGGSSPQPGRSVADCAGDVRAIAGSLGIDRLVVWGISGGGPHATACAALLPDLVAAAGVVASLAPYGMADLDYFEGMGELNADDIRLFFTDRDAARRKCREDWEQDRAITADELAEQLRTVLSPVDAAALCDEVIAWIVETSELGLEPGDQGWWDDSAACVLPWGFDFETIRVPVKVWHGRHDRFVPVQHGEWLARHIPGGEAEISATDGHLTLLERAGDVHEWLLARL